MAICMVMTLYNFVFNTEKAGERTSSHCQRRNNVRDIPPHLDNEPDLQHPAYTEFLWYISASDLLGRSPMPFGTFWPVSVTRLSKLAATNFQLFLITGKSITLLRSKAVRSRISLLVIAPRSLGRRHRLMYESDSNIGALENQDRRAWPNKLCLTYKCH